MTVRRYTKAHTPDIARRWEGRLLACRCGFRCRQDADMAAHCADPDRDVFRLPVVPLPVARRNVFRVPYAPYVRRAA